MNQKSLDKKKTKELDWEKEFDKKFQIIYSPRFIGDKCNFEIKDFIQSLLTQQRTELLEEILGLDILKEEPDTNDYQGGKNYIRENLKEDITNLLNKKDE